jgi:hypothetical protein
MAKTQKGMRGWRCANSRHARCSTRHAWKPLSAHLLSLQKLILSAKANYNIFKQCKPQKKMQTNKNSPARRVGSGTWRWVDFAILFFVQTMVFTMFSDVWITQNVHNSRMFPDFCVFPSAQCQFHLQPLKKWCVFRDVRVSHTFCQIKRALLHIFSFLHFVMLQTVRVRTPSANLNPLRG